MTEKQMERVKHYSIQLYNIWLVLANTNQVFSILPNAQILISNSYRFLIPTS
jgi:hypothetical protein